MRQSRYLTLEQDAVTGLLGPVATSVCVCVLKSWVGVVVLTRLYVEEELQPLSLSLTLFILCVVMMMSLVHASRAACLHRTDCNNEWPMWPRPLLNPLMVMTAHVSPRTCD